MYATAFLALALLLPFAGHARAQDVVPIAAVIEEFKAQIRDAQAADSADCPLRIQKVDFRFTVAQTTVFDANLGKEVTAFGVKLGGKVGGSRSSAQGSVIEITLIPDPKADDGLRDVSGAEPDFADLILHTKEQIAAAAEADPPLIAEVVRIRTDVSVKRAGEAGVSLAVIDAGAEATDEATHRVVLTLVPQEEGGC